MILRKIDEWILDRYQRVSDYIQNTIGGDCFDHSRLMFYASFCSTFVVIFFNDHHHNSGKELGSRSHSNLVWSVVIQFICLAVIRIGVLMGESEWRRSSQGTKNPNEQRLTFIRKLNLITFPIKLYLSLLSLAVAMRDNLLYGVLNNLDSLIWVSFLYLASCTPKPPKPKEEKRTWGIFSPQGA